MKIIITILVVLLGLGGGAYYAQDSGLYDFKQLKQYIPSQVQELLNIENTDVVTVSSDELEAIVDTDQDQNIQDSSVESQMVKENISMKPDTVYSGNEGSIAITENNSEIMNLDTYQKTQVAVNNSTSTQIPVEKNNISAPQKKSNVQVLDASPAEMKVVNELNKIESKIVKLDNEKEDLEIKYNQMIKKNRELALKIKDIDHQIKVMDSQ